MPVAEQAGRELLSLPLYPEITEAQQNYVVDELFDALSAAGARAVGAS
jgi:dTDP-4-amino-4,6-dideoxygalactose transaminase